MPRKSIPRFLVNANLMVPTSFGEYIRVNSVQRTYGIGLLCRRRRQRRQCNGRQHLPARDRAGRRATKLYRPGQHESGGRDVLASAGRLAGSTDWLRRHVCHERGVCPAWTDCVDAAARGTRQAGDLSQLLRENAEAGHPNAAELCLHNQNRRQPGDIVAIACGDFAPSV